VNLKSQAVIHDCKFACLNLIEINARLPNLQRIAIEFCKDICLRWWE